MPGGLIDAILSASAETIAWFLLAAMAAYFIAVYGGALRAKSGSGSVGRPIAYVFRVFREDARLMWVGFGSLLTGVFAFAFQAQHFGAAFAGIIDMIPALWTGSAIFGMSFANAVGYTNFPPIWVFTLGGAFGLTALIVRTIEFETEEEGD